MFKQSNRKCDVRSWGPLCQEDIGIVSNIVVELPVLEYNGLDISGLVVACVGDGERNLVGSVSGTHVFMAFFIVSNCEVLNPSRYDGCNRSCCVFICVEDTTFDELLD